MVKFEDLKGQILKDIFVSDDKKEIDFKTIEGNSYRQYHDQDCCEEVYIEEIIGDLQDLIGDPLLIAEEIIFPQNEAPAGVAKEDIYDDSFTWTFYKLATIKGSVTIRWFGGSNSYYSESVDFDEII